MFQIKKKLIPKIFVNESLSQGRNFHTEGLILEYKIKEEKGEDFSAQFLRNLRSKGGFLIEDFNSELNPRISIRNYFLRK